MQITVTGRHAATHAPEQGILHLTLSFESADKHQAMAWLEHGQQQLAQELTGMGTGPESPASEHHIGAPGTRSWHPWSNQAAPLPLQHAAFVHATVTFTDFKALAAWAIYWGERPGWNVDGVEWHLTDATQARLEEEALREAVAVARRRAETIAAAAGAGEVRFVEVCDPRPDSDDRVPHPLMARAAGGPDTDGVVIDPADVRVIAQVQARFEA